MGKNFLAKKSWHTGTISNMTKVWEAEQKADAEKKRIEELQKELKRERARKDIMDAATKGMKGPERVDWMYNAPMSAQVSAEEYLTGKQIDEKEEDQKEVQTLGLFQAKEANATQEAWNKMMEDPLYDIQRREKESLDGIKSNPVKMQQIRQKLLELEAKTSGKKKKKKRDRDREKKREDRDERRRRDKGKEKHRSRRERGDGERRERDERRRSRSPTKNADVAGLSGKTESSHRHAHDDRRNDDRRDDDRGHRDSRDKRRDQSRERRERRERSRDRRDDRRRDSHRDDSRRNRHEEEERERKRSRSPELDARSRSRSPLYHRQAERRPREDDRVRYTGYKRARDDRRDDEERKRRRMEGSGSQTQHRPRGRQRRPQLSEEEMKKRLEEMEADAEKNVQEKLAQIRSEEAEVDKDKEEYQKRDYEGPNFISKMNEKIYTGTDETIEDRLRRNRHYRQKGNVDVHSFL